MGELASQWNNLIAEALRLLNAGLVSLGLNFPFLSSWAITIMLFTVIIVLATVPLNLQQFRSTKKTARLQPQLQALQKQYGKDREKLLQAQQELYKQHGVNPLQGCLPMLIQMPIWIGLYSALLLLAHHEDFANSRFLWISNLALTELTDITGIANAGPEVIFRWPPAIPVLALLSGITGWIQQKMMTSQVTDPSQQSMQAAMQFMPLMFVFFALSVPSGLVLYWVASNLCRMVQQWAFERWGGVGAFAPAVALAAPEPSNGRQATTPKGPAPAVASRADAPARADGAARQPVGNPLPQAAPGAKKRRRRSR